MGFRVSRLAAVLLTAAVLPGCETLGDVFGSAADEKLPGERVSVLSVERGVRADSAAAEVPLRMGKDLTSQMKTSTSSATRPTAKNAMVATP